MAQSAWIGMEKVVSGWAILRAHARALILGITVIATPAIADELAAPTGAVIVEISGNIGNTNGDGIARFDLAMLQALRQVEHHTTTPWDEEKTTYTGPLARDVLNAVGAQGTVLVATALNDYQVEIPIAEFAEYDVIFALMRDGEIMTVRERGPIFIVYPFDDHAELRREEIYQHSIWQMTKIRVD